MKAATAKPKWMTPRRRTILLVIVVIAALLLVPQVLLSLARYRHTQIAKSGRIYVEAIYAFHAQTGWYPASLQELVPTFLHDAPTNDVVAGWAYRAGTTEDPNAGFLLSKHG